MDAYTTEVSPSGVDGWWTLKVKASDGLWLEYHYKSLQQAKFMAAVFEMGPSVLPPAGAIHFPPREKKRVRRQRVRQANVTPDEVELAVDAIAN